MGRKIESEMDTIYIVIYTTITHKEYTGLV